MNPRTRGIEDRCNQYIHTAVYCRIPRVLQPTYSGRFKVGFIQHDVHISEPTQHTLFLIRDFVAYTHIAGLRHIKLAHHSSNMHNPWHMAKVADKTGYPPCKSLNVPGLPQELYGQGCTLCTPGDKYRYIVALWNTFSAACTVHHTLPVACLETTVLSASLSARFPL